MKLAALILLAPAFYTLIGLGCLRLVASARDRMALAPLLGFIVAGWLPQVALGLGGVPHLVALALAALALIGLAAAREEWRTDAIQRFVLFYFCYAVGVGIFAVAPLPALGLWGTDWAMYLRAGPALLEYASDPSAHAALPQLLAERPRLFAARPHLFSTAVAPIAMVGWVPPLVALQLAAAVAAAGLVTALGYVAQRLARPQPSLLWVAFFLSLPLYGYQLIAVWPKLAATGCVLVGLVEAHAYRSTRRTADLAWSWVWLGFAIAAHHASALYLPLLLGIVGYDASARSRLAWRSLARSAALGAPILLATAGVYELWALSELGLAARIANNPSIHQASSFEPVYLAVKSLQQLLLSVFGASFPYLFAQVSKAANAQSLELVLGHASNAVSGWLVFLAGTFVGNLAPLLVVAWREVVAAGRAFRALELFAPVCIGAGIALVGSALLAPVLHLSSAQLGATPVCVGLVWYVSSSRTFPVKALRAALWVSLGLGTLPFALHLVSTRIAFGRALSGQREILDWFLRFEGDTRLLLSLDATPLSQLVTLPSAILIGLMIVLPVVAYRRLGDPEAT